MIMTMATPVPMTIATTTTTTTVATVATKTTKTPMRAGRGRMVMMVVVSLFVLIMLQFFSLSGSSEFLTRATTATTSAATTAEKKTTKKTTTMKEYCHFELANGHFVGGNEENWNWTWIPDENENDEENDDDDEENDVNNNGRVNSSSSSFSSSSSSSSSSCSQRYQDYPKLLLQQQQQQKQQQEQEFSSSTSSSSSTLSLLPQQQQQSQSQSQPLRRLKQPLQLISIGDSISRNQVQHFCKATEFQLLPQTYNEILLQIQNHNLTSTTTTSSTSTTTTTTTTTRLLPSNHAKWKFTNIISCSNFDTSISASILGIFGMIRPCWNGNVAVNVDSRIFNTTIERIQTLLKPEILEPLQQLRNQKQKQQQASSFPTSSINKTTDHNTNNNVKTIFYLHSALWDISTGCNDAPTIHPTYEMEYRQGIIDLYTILQELVPNSSIYWRTSTPLTTKYNQQGIKGGRGRTRSNQIQLNHILKTTVTKYQLGTVIDWWNQIGITNSNTTTSTGVKEEEEEEEEGNEYGPSSNNNNNNINNNGTTATTTRTMMKKKKKEKPSVVPEPIWNRYVPDGIHPTIEPSLSGYNLFLNTLFDQEGDDLFSFFCGMNDE